MDWSKIPGYRFSVDTAWAAPGCNKVAGNAKCHGPLCSLGAAPGLPRALSISSPCFTSKQQKCGPWSIDCWLSLRNLARQKAALTRPFKRTPRRSRSPFGAARQGHQTRECQGVEEGMSLSIFTLAGTDFCVRTSSKGLLPHLRSRERGRPSHLLSAGSPLWKPLARRPQRACRVGGPRQNQGEKTSIGCSEPGLTLCTRSCWEAAWSPKAPWTLWRLGSASGPTGPSCSSPGLRAN